MDQRHQGIGRHPTAQQRQLVRVLPQPGGIGKQTNPTAEAERDWRQRTGVYVAVVAKHQALDTLQIFKHCTLAYGLDLPRLTTDGYLHWPPPALKGKNLEPSLKTECRGTF